jgi:hypothetical protein
LDFLETQKINIKLNPVGPSQAGFFIPVIDKKIKERYNKPAKIKVLLTNKKREEK